MKKSVLRSCVSAASLAVMTVHAMPALAQDTPAAEEAPDSLDEIVVTASGRDKTQLNSSVSVTSINSQLIEDFKPSSESELYRMIPGIQVAGTAGPGGNSNIAVRGLPVATGGSPFVQIQEDGLPTVLFGDIQFGNNDYWTRFDASVANIEGVRGGSAATYASQAPGAVLNYISHTGEKEGGYIQLNKGVGYSETKVDFRYGGSINDTLTYHDVLAKDLKVMDASAIALMRDSGIPIVVFSIREDNSLRRTLTGEGTFTVISSKKAA